jgi:hypothetical protein
MTGRGATGFVPATIKTPEFAAPHRNPRDDGRLGGQLSQKDGAMNTLLVTALAVTGILAIFFLLLIVVALVEFYAGLLLLDDRLGGRLGGRMAFT